MNPFIKAPLKEVVECGKSRIACVIISALLGQGGLAYADDGPLTDDADAQGGNPEAQEDVQVEQVEDSEGRFRLLGRIFVGHNTTRTDFAGDPVWRSGIQLNSARIGLKYEEGDFLKTDLTLEVSDGDAEIRDAYLELEPGHGLELVAGRFKRPLSAFALASRWDLPVIERGLLSLKVEGRELDIVGDRGNGVLVSYRFPLATRMEVSLSAFESEGTEGLIDASENLSQDVYLRAYVDPHEDLRLASTLALIGYYREAGVSTSYAHAPLGSLDMAYTGPHLRAWVEGFAGENHFARVGSPASGHFLAGRAFFAPRFRTGVPRRLVPYLGGSYFDPRIRESDDSNTEVQGGLDLAFSKTWRVQLEAAHVVSEGASSVVVGSTVFRVQIAARYRE